MRTLATLLLGLSALLCLRHSTQAQTLETDTTTIELPAVFVRGDGEVRPLTAQERQAYWRRVRDVKKTLPYARYVAATLIETYEFTEQMTPEERDAHLKRVERELRIEIEPKMRDLTLSQGKVLIKLIHRQSGSTSYELVKAILGGWRAWWWNQFAKFTGANLKSAYRPEEDPDDAVTERIVRLVELGML